MLSSGLTTNCVTFVYCVSTSVVLSLITLVLFLSEIYLQIGNTSTYPLYVSLLALETIKWSYARFLQQRECALSNKKNKVLLVNILRTLSIKVIFKCLITNIASVIVYYAVAVLFGAQLFEAQEQTLMFSLLLTVLTIFPLCLNLGSSSVPHFLNGLKPTDTLHQLLHNNIKATLAGAWLGAIVIPLDWNRPWQEWPVPCSSGAVCGYLLSHYAMLIYLLLTTQTSFSSRKKQ